MLPRCSLMNPTENIPRPLEALDEIDLDAGSSVEDFIKELEAKEKDLHITADYQIEVEDSDFDPEAVPEFVQAELDGAVAHDAEPPAAASKPQPGLKTRVYELEREVEKLTARIAELKEERSEIQEKSDRRLKDFENYKYRMDRERRGSFIDQIANLASQMLPVLDNLDRALDSVEKNAAEKTPDFQQFYDGIVLVNQQVNEVFAEMGVQPIVAIGEIFDPNFHEAVATEERDDVPHNLISGEMLRGWRIGNRVIRHSLVKVSIAPPAARQVPAPEPIPEPTDVLPEPADTPADE